jgi:pyruvate,water dikinase
MIPLTLAYDATRHGGKAAGLACLIRAGCPVPLGIALPWDGDPRIPVTDTLLAIDPLATWAVRSSAVGEDSSAASFAGQHDTLLHVPLADVPAAIAHVRASVHTPRAVAYRRDRGMVDAPRMGVVVQRMVNPVVASAVVFTRDPMDGADVVVIEWTPGLGDTLVSGSVTPEQLMWTRAYVRAPIVAESPWRFRSLARAALAAEGAIGAPVDVEAAYDGSTWWLCQARPITT